MIAIQDLSIVCTESQVFNLNMSTLAITRSKLKHKMIKTNWCVLTGAPCSGKTTALNVLKDLGYRCIPEMARVYIEDELSKGHSLKEIRADERAFQKKVV